MNMDNIFWPKLQKQIASLFLRAQGWDIGLVRQAGGGVLDTGRIAKQMIEKKGFDKSLLDRPAFLASTIVTYATLAAAYQYMKTGEAPNSMLDFMAPRTGGIVERGTNKEAERIQLPGHGKELMQMVTPTPGEGPLSGVSRELYNKVATLPKNLYEAYENQNYRSDPIGNVTGDMGWLGSLGPRIGHVAEGFVPFSLGEQGALKEGSNLNAVERHGFGLRPAGMQIGNPQGLEALIEKENRQKWETKLTHEASPSEKIARKAQKKAEAAAKRKAKKDAEEDDTE
jgi:hypothetical protein